MCMCCCYLSYWGLFCLAWAFKNLAWGFIGPCFGSL